MFNRPHNLPRGPDTEQMTEPQYATYMRKRWAQADDVRGWRRALRLVFFGFFSNRSGQSRESTWLDDDEK